MNQKMKQQEEKYAKTRYFAILFFVIFVFMLIVCVAVFGKSSNFDSALSPQTKEEQEQLTENLNNKEVIDWVRIQGDELYDSVVEVYSNPNKYYGRQIAVLGIMHKHTSAEKEYCYCMPLDQRVVNLTGDGIEFVPEESFVPMCSEIEDGTFIMVLGILDAYEENGQHFLALRDTEIIEYEQRWEDVQQYYENSEENHEHTEESHEHTGE